MEGIKRAENLQLLTLCEPDAVLMSRECMCSVIDACVPMLKRLVIVGGWSHLATNSSTMFEYDLSTETWRIMPFTNPFTNLYAVCPCGYNDMVYFTRDDIYTMKINKFLEYTPDIVNDCSIITKMAVNNPEDFRYDDGSTFVWIGDGKILCIGGHIGEYGNGRNRTVEACAVFSIDTSTWSVINRSRMNMRVQCVRLEDGRVLLSGGMRRYHDDMDVQLLKCMIFNPKMNRFTRAPDMKVRRWAHACCLLKSGRVLVCGGYVRMGFGRIRVVNSCEEYDPVKREFVEVGSMIRFRRQHKCVLLPSGKVLIIGGDDELSILNDRLYPSCEMYDPETKRCELASRMPQHLMNFAVIPLYQ